MLHILLARLMINWIYVLLATLKIIGILIVVLLAILLLLILVILFIPFRYRLNGIRDSENLQGKLKISWLLHLFSVNILYEDGEINVLLRILGIPKKLYLAPQKKKRWIFGKKIVAKKTTEEKMVIDTSPPNEIAQEVKKEIPSKLQSNMQSKAQKTVQSNIQSKIQSKGKKWWQKKIPKAKGIKRFLEKCKDLWKRGKRKIESLKKKIKSINDGIYLLKEKIELLGSDMTKNTWKRYKKHLCYLWRHLGPRKIQGYLKLGFEDPALTGITTGVIYLLLPQKCNRISVQPEFEQIICEGELTITGRIRIIHLAKVALQVFLDKERKELIKKLRT